MKHTNNKTLQNPISHFRPSKPQVDKTEYQLMSDARPGATTHLRVSKFRICCTAHLFCSEPSTVAVRLASVIVLLLGQFTLHHKDGVALLPQRGQKGAEVELRQRLRRWKEGVEVPEVCIDAADGEPMLLHSRPDTCA